MLVRTDNGTNFVSGEKELCTAFRTGTDRLFMNICCNKKFVGFSTPQQRRTMLVFRNGV